MISLKGVSDVRWVRNLFSYDFWNQTEKHSASTEPGFQNLKESKELALLLCPISLLLQAAIVCVSSFPI